MLTEFQKRKHALAFYKFDASQDGVVEKSDFELHGQKIAAHLGLAVGSAAYQQVVKRAANQWDTFFQAADRNGDGQITLEEFFESSAHFVARPDAFRIAIEENKVFFDAIAADGSEQIQIKAFKAVIMALGVSEAAADHAFAQLDRDGDGQITRDEFAQNLADYYMSNDPQAVGNWFYGGY